MAAQNWRNANKAAIAAVSAATNPSLQADEYKIPAKGYKVTVGDGDTGAGRAAAVTATIADGYRCISITSPAGAILYRLDAAPTLTNFDGIVLEGGTVKIRLPDDDSTIRFITVATGASTLEAYITSFKEVS
jgi:hypothetical protein